HVSELLACLILMGAPTPLPAVTANRRLRDAAAGFSDAGPVLDAQAKAECKRRLKDLRQELEEAERFNDPGRAAKARHEVTGITRRLASATGLPGRDRKD